MVDSLDFEELALKSIDLSLSPSVADFRSVSESKKVPLSVSTVPFRYQLLACALTRETKISLVFPPSLLSPSEVLSELRGFVEYRVPKHRRGFYLWMGIAPLTAPFKLIRTSTSCLYPFMSLLKKFLLAIIPNLPFFFCAWRSWSHYRGIFLFKIIY